MVVVAEQIAHSELVGGGATTKHSHAGGGGTSFTELAGGQAKVVSSTSVWQDWDLSAIVPSGTVAVLVAIGANTTSSQAGARKKGSSLERRAITPDIAAASNNSWAVTIITECDINRIIQIYCAVNTIQFNIIGYWS